MNKDRIYSKSAYRTKPALRAQVTGRVGGKYTCTTSDGRVIPGVKGGIYFTYPTGTWVDLGQNGSSYVILEVAASAGGPHG